MPNPYYTDRQVEAANLLRSSVGEGVSQGAVDEIVEMIGEAERQSVVTAPLEDTESIIRMKLLNETDWRKRAALSAMLISKSFD